MKRFVWLFTNVMIAIAFCTGVYFIGYTVGKQHGYYQRRDVEVEIGKMLYERSKKAQKNMARTKTFTIKP